MCGVIGVCDAVCVWVIGVCVMLCGGLDCVTLCV